jgi:thiamine-phosphate pyrophosphorylase
VTSLPSSLYVICDADVCERAGWKLADYAAACLDGGARFLQVRAKHAAARWLLDTTIAVVRRAGPAGALVMVNDRADLALLAGAGGVHVGQEDLAPASVRLIAGPEAVVGLSTHTPEQYEAASREPVSYIAVGPVFGTITKSTGYEPVGLAHVRRAAAHASARGVPIVAIGGISLERARPVIEAGARSVAVITDILATGDPAKRVEQFLLALGETR